MFVKEEQRELARIVQIEKLLPVPKADRLEIAVVGGWEVVVLKGEHQIGEPVVYFEIDAAIPLDHPLWHDFDKKYLRIRVEKGTNKEFATIKTIRLRGALSQGLALPMKYLNGTDAEGASIGQNVTNALGVLKYVSPEEAKLYAAAAGEAEERKGFSGMLERFRARITKGIVQHGQLPWPAGHIKSDEERVQNLKGFYEQAVEDDHTHELSVKLDGESTTFYTDVHSGDVGAASRNHALRVEDVPYTKGESRRVFVSDWIRFLWRRFRGATAMRPTYKKGFIAQSNATVAYFHRHDIGARIQAFNMGGSAALPFVGDRKLTIQGEMVGPGYNKSKEGLNEVRFFMYRAYLNGNLLVNPRQARQIAYQLGLDYVPVLDPEFKLPADMKALLKLADGPGHFDKQRKREGVVVKCNETGKSFKVISNAWLEKEAKEEEAQATAEAAPAEATA